MSNIAASLIIGLFALGYLIGYGGIFAVAISPLWNKNLTKSKKIFWMAVLIGFFSLNILFPIYDVQTAPWLCWFVIPLAAVYIFLQKPQRWVKITGMIAIPAWIIGILGQMLVDGRF